MNSCKILEVLKGFQVYIKFILEDHMTLDVSFVPFRRLTQPQGNRQARVLDQREPAPEVYFMPMSNPPAKRGSRFLL